MDDNKVREILKKYNEGICSEEEKEWVESWYLDMTEQSAPVFIDDADMLTAKRNIWKNISAERLLRVGKRKIYTKIVAAASILIITGLACYLYISNTQLKKEFRVYSMVKPGGNKAYLTLSNGKKINLTDLENGMLAEQSGIKILKKANGELVYEISEIASSDNLAIIGNNIIETPAGGQYQVVLPDGTKVWLNSSSSLKYPVKFSGNERRVTLNGEGYFEVKSDKQKPFRVVSGNQTVEVLGTKFNINTYKDEPALKTTLLEGSVKVSVDSEAEILRPGEQAVMNGQKINIHTVDTEQIVAWYKGDFAFDGTELSSIMRQISRWYDVDVVYEGDIAGVKFGGSISRSKDIKEVLKVLAMTQGVNFKLEGRRIVVMP